ncbi:MAG: T9SS type A sorting domain-containing protein [Candidatus Zixiibacteriota bacterium]
MGTGFGGVTVDIPDGITYDEVEIAAVSGTFSIDAVAARMQPVARSSSDDHDEIEFCFFADTSGLYELIISAEDEDHDGDHSDDEGADTIYVTVIINNPPVADAGSDQSLLLCQLSEICLGVSFADPDGNLVLSELISGPGTLVGGQICFTPPSAGAYSFVIHCIDSCGLEDFDTVLVAVALNGAPVVDDPVPVTQFLCAPQQLCHQFTATDPDNDSLIWTFIGGVGSISPTGLFCFTPTVSGTYSAAVLVTDACGQVDTASIQYSVMLNSGPSIVDPGGPFTVFQCNPGQICYQFVATDPDSGLLVWSKISGVGSLSAGGLFCFTPTSSGLSTITVAVVDSCGFADTVSLSYDITINDTPSISFGSDSSLQLCVPQPVCISYQLSDPQGLSGLAEVMESGFGTIDTAANEICFTPAVDGAYEFVVSATDSCGFTDRDTIVVNITFGAFATITCPTETIAVSLCSPGPVCYLLPIVPPNATVTTSMGTYAGGELCFNADTSGIYVVTVIASEQCGDDTCTITFNIDIGQAAQISCPPAQDLFVCDADTVCIPLTVMGSGVAVAVSPIGSYQSGNICFPADSSGHYELLIVATTSCGTDSCLLVADITINSPPLITDAGLSIDTFLCAPGQACYQFSASDPNGGSMNWLKLSGSGTVDGSGLWCFDATASGTYSVTVQVIDSCGAIDTTSFTFNVTVNAAPLLSLGNDTTIFQCNATAACLPYVLSDVDGNIDSLSVTCGDAVIDTLNSRLCFVPTASGTYLYCVTAYDACGTSVTDSIQVTIAVNEPPWVDAGADQTIFQCSATQICWSVSASDVDGNLSTVELLSGVGNFDGSQICFSPTGSANYQFILKATDSCGAESFDTVVIDYTLNSAPSADAGNDTTLFLCQSQQVCIEASCDDIDGNLSTCALVSGNGSYDGSAICFTPNASGSYTFVLEATDACGVVSLDTVVATVTINSAPVCLVPADTTIFQCVQAEVCLPVSATDDDNNLLQCQIVSGPGSLVGGQWCYTPVGHQVITVVIECEDSCGATCQSQFTVDFNVNGPPQISFGNDTTIFLCNSQQVCLPYNSFDPDFPAPTTVTLLSGPGSIDTLNSQVCFTPTVSGAYTFVVQIQDECSSQDTDTINVTIAINQAPLANTGADQSLFLCDDTNTICWSASCSDADGNLTDCIFSGPGIYDGTQICFQPSTSGTYQFTLLAQDACGEQSADTVTISVTINSAPSISLVSDTSVFLCAPQEICVGYVVSDADGLSGLTESMASGFGSLDTAANQVCFTPTAPGDYEFVLCLSDSCGQTICDTLVVHVTFGEIAQISCPVDTVFFSLCDPDTVCKMIDIQPASATVTVSVGWYADGELCFFADTSGIYNVDIIASESCGADTCSVVCVVDIGQVAQIECSQPQSVFLCGPDTVCLPVTVVTPGATVVVSPIGHYQSGMVCFPADTSGHYELSVVASTSCGSDSCTLIADVTLNEAPIADDPTTPIDTFLCSPAQICYQFTATDAEPLTWTRLSGSGTVTPGGLWCFDATSDGQYCVSAEVSDSCGATDVVNLCYNVSINDTPLVVLTSDTTIFLCANGSLCFTYSVTDTDSNVTLEELVSGAGTIDTSANQFCFTPDTAGFYCFVVQVTDACGTSANDSICVTVQINTGPTADAGAGQSLFLCSPSQICWDAACSDPDNNLDSCYLISGPGTYDGSQICFDASASGSYTFVLRAVDQCGLSDEDTVVVNITLNSPPVCEMPSDTSYFLCGPTLLTLPVGADDVDNNFDHCEMLGGLGSVAGGNWTFTPAVDDSFYVKVLCLDSCGASCIDSFLVVIDMNSAPVADAGDDSLFFVCNAGALICWPAGASDVDSNLQTTELISPNGTYDSNAGQICFNVPANETTYEFIIKATDSCGETDFDTSYITIDLNAAPTIGPMPDFTAFLDEPGQICLSVTIDDEDGNLSSVIVVPDSANPDTIVSYAAGQICFNAPSAGIYCFYLTARDDCGAEALDTVCVDVQIDECLHVQIEKSHNSLQGQHQQLEIFLNGAGKPLGGYDLLLAYDPTALIVSNVLPGQLLVNCGWEYFTYRFGGDGNCGNGCPSGLLRIVAMAETNNGANHPGCFLDGMIGSLATIDFLVSNDRTLECQYAPVRFFWLDCGDNAFASQEGDTLWISRNVYDFELNNLTDNLYGFPGFFGAPDLCLSGGGQGKPAPIRCVDYTNGGIDIVCADSIDDRGDINLNGLAYEIADAVLFSNYFVFGLSVFTVNADGQIAASDVNADGLTLSVADLVYLIRVVIGDAPAFPKLNPDNLPQAEFALIDGVLSVTETDYPIGAISVTLDGKVEPTLHEEAAGMDLQYSFDGTSTHILVYNLTGRLSLGVGPVMRIEGSRRVKTIEVGSYDGFVMSAKIETLPTTFELSQNYPNPFNPSTTIRFALPQRSEWTLNIYNVLGQQVEHFSRTSDAGYVEIEWQAGRYASGLYFYRLTAGSFSATRKMVLLK